MKFRVKSGGNQQIRVVATAAHTPGDLAVYGGFITVYTGVINCAIGDVINVTLDAVGEAVTASGVTFASGAAVYWDTAGLTCVAAAGGGIVKLGTAVVAKTSGQLVTQVLMNKLPI